MTTAQLPILDSVTSVEWARLAQRRIFFGHQSVGQNIMDGVADVLVANPRIRLSVLASKDLDTASAAGLYHAPIGRNRFPAEKTAEFATVVDRAFGSGDGVAMVKYCYVDVQEDTDPAALFEAYQARIADLSARHPGLIIVHFTMPLERAAGALSSLKARLLGRQSLNAIRNRYNTLLRQAYEGRAPVFDLARLESTRADGSRSFEVRGADTIYTLAEEYTEDGGHLDASARRMVAEQFLIFLAKLPPS
jgi:hypothetical protein